MQISRPAFHGRATRIEPASGGAWRLLPDGAHSPRYFLLGGGRSCASIKSRFVVPHSRSGENLRGSECGHSAGVGQVLAGGDLYHMVSDKTINSPVLLRRWRSDFSSCAVSSCSEGHRIFLPFCSHCDRLSFSLSLQWRPWFSVIADRNSRLRFRRRNGSAISSSISS